MRVTRRMCLAGLAALPFAAPALADERVGRIERFDPALDTLVDSESPIEVIASGYRWAEGPVWVQRGGYLLFSDVPANTVHRWVPGGKAEPFLSPSGLAGPIPPEIREAGANGLAVDGQGRLILADSGSRAVAALDLKTKQRTVLADRYQGKRFNSCNDVAVHRGGIIFFTDPPYGLAEGDTSPIKELPFNGVFRVDPDGKVTLIADDLKRPNGIALSPDQRTLYVAMSDEVRPQILAYALDAHGVRAERPPAVFHDFADVLAKKLPGLPDGLKVDRAGNVFASGPGGIHVLSPAGKRLGLIATGKATANCAFGEDGRTLFLTSSDMVARVRLKTFGW